MDQDITLEKFLVDLTNLSNKLKELDNTLLRTQPNKQLLYSAIELYTEISIELDYNKTHVTNNIISRYNQIFNLINLIVTK